MRNLPEGFKITIDESTKNFQVEYHGTKEMGKLSMKIATRLEVGKMDNLFHPFPKTVISILKEEIQTKVEEENNILFTYKMKEMGITESAILLEITVEDLNKMYGFNKDGKYKHNV